MRKKESEGIARCDTEKVIIYGKKIRWLFEFTQKLIINPESKLVEQ